MPTPVFTLRLSRALKKKIVTRIKEEGIEESISGFMQRWAEFGVEHGENLKDAAVVCSMNNGVDYCKNCGMNYKGFSEAADIKAIIELNKKL